MFRHPPLTIVTGASSNHARCLMNLLESLALHEPDTERIVVDLGLRPAERERLAASEVTLRKFAFRNYPPHVNIRVHRGQYAWKPILVADLLRERGGMVLWLDAGNLVHRPLDRVRAVLTAQGVYSPTSNSTVAKWTHPGTLERLGVDADLLALPNRNGALVGFNAQHRGVVELAERWKACALDKDCIAPPGSSRKNHRQDQAVLTVLLYQHQRRYGCVLEDNRLDVSTHNDRLSQAEARLKMEMNETESELQEFPGPPSSNPETK